MENCPVYKGPIQNVIVPLSVWKKAETFEVIHESLVEETRKAKGRKEEPSVGIIDAQSVKNTLVSSQDNGFDAGKKIKGIKRHIIVDTLGLILP